MEIQIRTHKMHYIAEYGFAAHWKYKEKLSDEDEWLNKVRYSTHIHTHTGITVRQVARRLLGRAVFKYRLCMMDA